MQRMSIKPLLLVALRITRDGGLSVTKEDLENTVDGEHEVRTWTVTRDVPNITELRAADRLAAECRRMITAFCVRTKFGLIAPKDVRAELDAAWAAVKDKVAVGNQQFTGCQLRASCIRGEILTSDQEAADAILHDLASWFRRLDDAVRACDAQTIRDTLTEMKGADMLLGPEHSKVLQDAVATAKQIATTVTAEVGKKHREMEEVKRELDFAPLDAAAFYFIDVSTPGTLPELPVHGSIEILNERLVDVEEPVEVGA